MSESYIDLYRAALDYVTLTFWDYETVDRWAKKVDFHEPDKKITIRAQQYLGDLAYFQNGSIFVGEGTQKGMPHYVVRISGNMADDLKRTVFKQRLAHLVTCTRVDLQVTIPEPKGWSQIALLNRIHRTGKVPGWASSVDQKAGKLETVYIGSWHADRLSTVYVKLTKGNSRLLRLETRYKGDRANAVLPQLAAGELPDNFLRHELMNVINDKKLRDIFEPHLVGNGTNPATVRVKQKDDKTAEWLIDKVLPTFSRIISESDSDGEVFAAFYEAMEKVINYGQ